MTAAQLNAARRSRQFSDAYRRALSAYLNPTQSIGSVESALCIARIYFEFGRFPKSISWLRLAEDATKSDAERAPLITFRIWAEYRSKLPPTWDMGREAVRPTITQAYLLNDEQLEWLDRMSNCNTAPSFDASEPLDLVLAGCQQHRHVCLAKPEIRAENAERARRYFRRIEDSRLLDGFAGEESDPYLSMMPHRIQFLYQKAAFLFETGDLVRARTAFEALLATPEGSGHVAGHLGLVQLSRALMEPAQVRREAIKAASLALRRNFTPKPEPDAIEEEVVVGMATELHYLERQRSLTYTAASPDKAHEILASADALFDTQFGHSYGRIRNLTKSAAHRVEIEQCRTQIIEAYDLHAFADYLILPTGTEQQAHYDLGVLRSLPIADLLDDAARREDRFEILDDALHSLPIVAINKKPTAGRERERALLAIVDAQRSLGADTLSLGWYRAISQAIPSSALAAARYISLLTSLGYHDEAVGYAQEVKARSQVPTDHLPIIIAEQARAELNAGQYDEAESLFESLHSVAWRQLAVDGYAGILDVWRRRRDLQKVASTAKNARMTLASCDRIVTAEIDIAEGWAEVQLGSPRQGVAILLQALDQLPFSLGAWIGVTRGLRMLGCHNQALEVTSRLLGISPDPEVPLEFWDEKGGNRSRPIPNLSLRHAGRIHNERGWALLDLDQLPEAATEFRHALHRSPNLSPSYRGLIKSSAETPDSLSDAVERGINRLAASRRNPEDVTRDMYLEAGQAALKLNAKPMAERYFATARNHLNRTNPGAGVVRRFNFALADAYLDSHQIPQASSVLRSRVSDLHEVGVDQRHNDERGTIFDAKLNMISGRAEDALHIIDNWLDTHPHGVSEPLRIARFVAAFENRDFERCEDYANDLGGLNGEALPDDSTLIPRSEVKALLLAWTNLALSELPAYKSEVPERIEAARGWLMTTDQTSVDELHLRAILEARGSAINEGSYENARQHIELALVRRPLDGSLMRDKGAILLGLGQRRLAEETLRRAHHLAPHDARIHLLLGATMFQLGKTSGAIEHFQTAASLDPNDYVHHRALVLAQLNLGRLDGAAAAVEVGLNSVRTARRFRLELLKARVAAEQAILLPARRRGIELRAIDAQLVAAEPGNDHEEAERLARRGYIAAVTGSNVKARLLLSRASGLDPMLEEVERVRRQLPIRSLATSAWIVGSTAAVSVVGFALLGSLAWSVISQGVRADSPELDVTSTLILLAMLAALPFLGPAIQRIRTLSLFDSSIELEPFEPLEETVHVDLDLSASDLLRISGFSNHRPSVPFDDVEPRTLDHG